MRMQYKQNASLYVVVGVQKERKKEYEQQFLKWNALHVPGGMVSF